MVAIAIAVVVVIVVGVVVGPVGCQGNEICGSAGSAWCTVCVCVKQCWVSRDVDKEVWGLCIHVITQ